MIRKETSLSLLCLLVVGVCGMMIQVGNTHLWDQDEGFYAATAAEMHARGDWVTPTFNGKLFAHKPPLMFWGMMAGYEMFGVSELGARFVSSLFGLGTVFLTYGMARRLFDAATGLFAGLAIGSCIMFTIVARSATADAHLTFFTVLAFYLWVGDYFRVPSSDRDNLASCDVPLSPFAPRTNEKTLLSRSERRQILESVRWQTWIATYAVMGLAVLTKGPIGFLFPMAVIGLFLLTEQRRALPTESTFLRRVFAWIKPYGPIPFVKTVWAMRPFTAAAMILSVSAPWYLLVQWRTNGAFLQEFIGVHHLGRMSQAMDNHSGPFYYYLLACLIGMYPWTAFAIPTVMSWFQQAMVSQQAKAVRFVSCWVAVYLVIFSLASTKLPNYVLPAYPALAIIIGRYFAMWTQDLNSVNRVWLKTGWILLIAFGGLIALGVPGMGLISWNGVTLLDRVGMDLLLQQRFVWLGVAGIPLERWGLGFFGAIGLVCPQVPL
jgi:4-amino-4-deoxy-L-arabinose transferase-like glycosyltransferase